MAFLKYVQAAVNGEGTSLHIQATGDAQPQGYASGNIDVSEDASAAVAAASRIPSMRGSGRLYAVLSIEDGDTFIEDEFVASLDKIDRALGNPRPPYSAADAAKVQERVRTTLDVAASGVEPNEDEPCCIDSKAEAISKAVDDFKQALLAILA